VFPDELIDILDYDAIALTPSLGASQEYDQTVFDIADDVTLRAAIGVADKMKKVINNPSFLKKFYYFHKICFQTKKKINFFFLFFLVAQIHLYIRFHFKMWYM